MPSFVKKLASKAAKKAINKVVDNVTGKIFGGFGGGGPGRIVGFGGMSVDPRFQSASGLIDYRGIFHEQLTENWNFQTPNRSLWYVVINGFPLALQPKVIKNLERTTVDNYSQTTNHHDTSPEYESVVGEGPPIPGHLSLSAPASPLQNLHSGNQMTGCLFAQGCQIPQESLEYSRASFNAQRGFMPGVVAGQRNDFNPLVIEFRETNTSFVDIVLRPWIILASHYGLATYPPEDLMKNIKTHIDVYQLALGPSRQHGHIIRKKFSFYNCVPFQIAQQGMTHDVDSGTVAPIDTQWMYSHYEFATSLDASMETNNPDRSPMEGISDPSTNQAGGSVLDGPFKSALDEGINKVNPFGGSEFA